MTTSGETLGAADGTSSRPSGSDGSGLTEAEGVRLAGAFDTWRGRLIDLSKRNRALNYRSTKVGTLRIVDEKPVEIYRLLVGEEKKFTFSATLGSPLEESSESSGGQGAPINSVPSDSSPHPDEGDDSEASSAQPFVPYELNELQDHHTDSDLRCQATPESLDNSLRRLSQLQQTSLEEQGVNTLYLALGFLHYKEAPQATSFLRAPLILVPVILERKGARSGYFLTVGDDEPVLNPSLVEYLRRVHEIKGVPDIPELSDEPSCWNLAGFYESWTTEVAAPREWKVTEEMVLATFAFQKLVLFKDLEANEERYRKHHLVQRVVLRTGEPERGLPPGVGELDLDQDYPPESTFQVLDADSSQLRTLAAVAQGHDLVIHGPPGTGKSQTIANLIADALGHGKSVLFVSEKMAALEVVHRRLTEARLGEFCLELHSTKAQKGKVLEDLRHTLNTHAVPVPGAVTVDGSLLPAREQLNRYARVVHERRTKLQCSSYEALGEFAANFEAPRFVYPSDPTDLEPELLHDLLGKLRRLETLGSNVWPASDNGWRDTRLTHFSEDVGHRVREVISEALQRADHFKETAQALTDTFGVPTPENLPRAATLAKVAGHLAQATGVPGGILRDENWKARPHAVSELLTSGRKFTALTQRLAGRYAMDALDDVDPSDAPYVESKLSGVLGFLAILDSRYRGIRRRWIALRASTTKLSMLDQVADFKLLPRWRSERAALDAHAEAPGWFGSAWRGAASDWSDMESRVVWVEQFHRMVAAEGPFTPIAYTLAEQGGVGSALPGETQEASRLLGESLDHLRSIVQWPAELLATSSIDEITSRLQELLRDVERGPAWVAFVKAWLALAGSPASALADACFAGILGPRDVIPAFKRALYGAWLEQVVPATPELADFSTATHEDLRRTFMKLDTGLLKQNQARLVSQLRDTGSNRYSSSPSAQRGYLQKEFAKQKRHRPLRVTLRSAGVAIKALKPCFMMSPMSVAQYLTPDMVFDLVVFDEASQLPTEDAIGAICRGKQLVVVGDPKQLPPTNFFSLQIGATTAALDENGEAILEETDSVLEEFQAAGLHEGHLEWHYRSAHQSLIQFSNDRFYGSQLVVFPSALSDGPEFGVHFEYIPEGRYEGAGLNSIEARRVAEGVIEHFKKAPQHTLGVGTFNQRQQTAILDELERYRREDPALEALFDRSVKEPFFVKNLENIQGDERDVILLSITYAKQADGRLRYNFGPLNRQEGWRRLNVLVSRARRRMKVFSSLRFSEINPDQTSTQGPALLRDFLEFAETGKMLATSRSPAAEADSLFELNVGEALEGMGYLVDRQVGVGGYRIDLGVRDRERPGRYLAGVECDGALYHSAPCARDRDRLRQQVLELRGWNIVRVWSTDWFKDRTGTLSRLKTTFASLRAAMDEEDTVRALTAVAAPDTPTTIEVPDSAPSQGRAGHIYERPSVPRYTMANRVTVQNTLLATAPATMVARVIKHIVDHEAPIHESELINRLLYFWEHTRRGTKLMGAAQRGIQRAVGTMLVVKRGSFLYDSEDGAIRPRNRSDLGVGAEAVAPEELMAVARVILGGGDAFQEDELGSEIREVLGLKRTEEGAGAIRAAIDRLVREGILIYSAIGLRLRPASGGD